MTKPVRLQLSRQKGFDLQAVSLAINGLRAANCARPGRWGNLWRVGLVACSCRSAGECSCNTFRRPTAEEAIEDYRQWMEQNLAAPNGRTRKSMDEDLRGKNLACWCHLCSRHKRTGKPLGESCSHCAPCHCDQLGEMANR